MVNFISDAFRTYVNVMYPDCVYMHDVCIAYELVFPENFWDQWKYAGVDLSHMYDQLNYDNDDYLIGYHDDEHFNKEVLIIVDTFISQDGMVTIEGYLDKKEIMSIEQDHEHLGEGIDKIVTELEKKVKRI